MSEPDPRVLYVLGIYHSGTTVLSNLIGQLDGFFCVGELRTLWPKLTLPESKCGCGELLTQCPVWSQILTATFGDGDERVAAARQMWQDQREALHEYHTWLRVRSVLRHARDELTADTPIGRYARGLARMYRGIAAHTGARVIVDASKEPTDAALLLRMTEFDPAFVQIVRDPRGTVYSILRFRTRDQMGARSRWRQSAYAAMSWSAGNLAGGAVRRDAGPARSALLRYEDFVLRPHETVAALAGLAGQANELARSGDAGTVTFGTTHTVGGNNNRFRTGPVRLHEDTEWRTNLHRVDQAAVTAMCAPLMARYGYSLS